ncbi:anthranilate synthase component I family protein [Cesiribacter andamanensis]|uniref:Para-aminobenzoate synthase component 1 n=1 Tax=Cesiribacter andamanensis AMV16 TaxID=1279009 RepID=M7N552_9BACT|nr:anthranilate synthase component I family protein [Cesiribacter andamanensis]EMR02427.1 Para-aminobenzoate synthase component 1 [Cesiribacter andamanensis AMV16]
MQQEHFPLSPGQHEPFIQQALQWGYQEAPYLAYYDHCNISYPFAPFPRMLGLGARPLPGLGNTSFEQLQAHWQQQPDWYLGYFSYELKNGIHGLSSNNPDRLAFPHSSFFSPDHLLIFAEGGVTIRSTHAPRRLYQSITQTPLAPLEACAPAHLQRDMSKGEYLSKVAAVKNHILEGDCYELNLCMQFWDPSYQEDPLRLFRQLTAASPAPFTSFQRHGEHFLISASPERFLRKQGDALLSQPIKGTMRRGATPEQDQALRRQLTESEKDRAENLMIVDLVRNDLARSSAWGSVAVPELFGIYSFRQVHQMISSISSRLRPGTPFTEALRLAFPMGSMTGAPKRMVMELIDRYETSQRGLYSGAAGFITPQGDFDFNVVIRSLLYNRQKKVLSFSVGGAITWDSDPEQEYQECLLKASAMLQMLHAQIRDE